ncbi:MAG: hypothetical protein ACJA2W_001717 [Planctomycetota bacterium]|jgi:hypothetical protein
MVLALFGAALSMTIVGARTTGNPLSPLIFFE